eukprot:NODE_3781_length_1164_cov_11.906820_g3596_i0.p1 GENE.NODE_3781_length_1164_cov_11.906820_g3596_i0~~NODE_3781_length_1164_cov_11.906820_g3596_i0.p1  ORF type:complete len:384 (-),score=38.41 NODE_3781_length_1164_cov_11.906820_g3596_i0:13-1080(-)
MITVDNLGSSVTLRWSVHIHSNLWVSERSHAAYFVVQNHLSHQTQPYSGTGNKTLFPIVDVSDSWGHLIGVTMRMVGPKELCEGNQVGWRDGSMGQWMETTGLEDYFGWGHLFKFQSPQIQSQPTTGVVGVGFSPKLTMHVTAYRRDLYGPLPFHDSLRLTSDISQVGKPSAYWDRALNVVLAWTSYLYLRPRSGLQLLQRVRLCGGTSTVTMIPACACAAVPKGGLLPKYSAQSAFMPNPPFEMACSHRVGAQLTFTVDLGSVHADIYGLVIQRVHYFVNQPALRQWGELRIGNHNLRRWGFGRSHDHPTYSVDEIELDSEELALSGALPLLNLTLVVRTPGWHDFMYVISAVT